MVPFSSQQEEIHCTHCVRVYNLKLVGQQTKLLTWTGHGIQRFGLKYVVKNSKK